MWWARVYYWGSIMVALLLVADTTVLLFGPPGGLDLAVSLAELLWLGVSLVTVVGFWRAELPIGLPVSFVGYSLASWIHSFYLIATGITPEQLRLPLWVVAAVDVYAVAYALAAAHALRGLGRRKG